MPRLRSALLTLALASTLLVGCGSDPQPPAMSTPP